MSFPTKDIFINLTMEVEVTNSSLEMVQILEILNLTLTRRLAGDIMISPDRFHNITITMTNQTRKSRADFQEISVNIEESREMAIRNSLSDPEDCPNIGCMSHNETLSMLELLRNRSEWVHVFYVSFVMSKGPVTETETDKVVGLMTNWIRENSFELELEGLNVKFTTLQERNVHDEKDLNWWCKDGDLANYFNEQFSLVDSSGRHWAEIYRILQNKNSSSELHIRINENKKIYKPENYVANILFQRSSFSSSATFNISGTVTVCENRLGRLAPHCLSSSSFNLFFRSMVECSPHPMTFLDPKFCVWLNDGSIEYTGGIFSVPVLLKRLDGMSTWHFIC